MIFYNSAKDPFHFNTKPESVLKKLDLRFNDWEDFNVFNDVFPLIDPDPRSNNRSRSGSGSKE